MFFQAPPALGNQYDEDRLLKRLVSRAFSQDVRRVLEPELRELGELSGGKLFRMQLEDRQNEPRLVSYDPWGNRVDHIEVSPLWREAQRLAASFGVVATGYDRSLGAEARLAQFAKVYLFAPSTDVYSCPLAMTDGAARTLLSHNNQQLVDRALPNLTSRDPDKMWTSGQWMTERTGGSDVGLTETVARKAEGQDGLFRLYGTKWFTSATTSQMTLTLGRPEGNPAGGKGLALFYVERVDGSWGKNNVFVNRLKDKLGTRKVPTAELTLDGALATPVAGLTDGVRNITPMLNITRTWNSICAIAGMRRAVALARDYATRRFAFGDTLSRKPLHAETLAGLQAELEAGFHLTFFLVSLLGRVEHGASGNDEALLRMATPIVKAVTGKQAVVVASEVLECFGGAGYVEDTGLPLLLRDAQVLPIWEGTTNVLSLDALKAIGAGGEGARAWREHLVQTTAHVRDERLAACAKRAVAATDRALGWLIETQAQGRPAVEAGARGLLLTLGRSMALALLCEDAQRALDEGDPRPLYAARRFANNGVDLLGAQSLDEASALANDA